MSTELKEFVPRASEDCDLRKKPAKNISNRPHFHKVRETEFLISFLDPSLDRLIDWLIDRYTACLIDWSIDRLIDWCGIWYDFLRGREDPFTWRQQWLHGFSKIHFASKGSPVTYEWFVQSSTRNLAAMKTGKLGAETTTNLTDVQITRYISHVPCYPAETEDLGGLLDTFHYRIKRIFSLIAKNVLFSPRENLPVEKLTQKHRMNVRLHTA